MDIPLRWTKALAAVQAAGFPEAIIAGGALRDLDNGVDVKDVDIFVLHRGGDTFDRLRKALADFEGYDETDADPAYQVDNPEVVGVFGFYDGGDEPIQIISCGGHGGDFLLYQIGLFDIGLCRIAYDGNSLISTDEYDVDKANQELRIRREHNLTRSIERAVRIGKKYPGWKLVGPDGQRVVVGVEGFDFSL